MSSVALRAGELSLTYADAGRPLHALSSVSLAINVGEFVAIVGPSGCGKTSLLRILAGLVLPTSGQVRLGSNQVAGPSRDIGVIFQRDTTFTWFSVCGNVEFALKGQVREAATRRARALALLRSVGLEEFALSWPRTLSGGMSQRLTLARAIATEPAVLLLDEPFSALDALSRAEMHSVLLDIWRERQMSVLLVTHDLDEAVTLADRVLIMTQRPGSIAADVNVDLPRPRSQKGVRVDGFDAVRNEIARKAGDLYRIARS